MTVVNIKTIFVLSLLTTSACGMFGNDKKDKSAIVPQETEIRSKIRWLNLEDPSCIQSKSSPAVSAATIYEWNGTETLSKVVTIPQSLNQRASKNFSSLNIEKSVLNFHADFNCKYVDHKRSCEEDKSATQSRAYLMKFCRNNGTYSRDSLEAMTLTTQYYSEFAYSFYASIPGHKSEISSSILLIQPEFLRHITKPDGTKVDRFDVDNASFTRLERENGDSQTGVFIVYPTSVASFESNHHNLWEVPFVMRHEFGHHVFRHYLTRSVASIGLTIHSETDISEILPTSERRYSDHLSLLSSKNQTAQNAISGMNETFADLYAYFSGGGNSDQVKGIACLETSRDPSKSETKLGSKKGMDQTQVDIYERRAEPAKKTQCGEPNFDNEHDISIALGQPIASFVETLLPNGSSVDRASMLLLWLTRIESLVSLGADKITIDTIVRELILAAKQQSELRSLTQFDNACENFSKLIPGLPLSVAACK